MRTTPTIALNTGGTVVRAAAGTFTASAEFFGQLSENGWYIQPTISGATGGQACLFRLDTNGQRITADARL